MLMNLKQKNKKKLPEINKPPISIYFLTVLFNGFQKVLNSNLLGAKINSLNVD